MTGELAIQARELTRVFGAFTAILATPCTAPLLPPLLIWASAQKAYVGVPAMLLVILFT